MTLGKNLKDRRIKMGMTQKDLADKMNVTFQTISKWENDENEPDLATLKKLASLYGCSLDELLDFEAETPQEETPAPQQVVERVIEKEAVIIHQKEAHVCARCHRDIEEGDLEIDTVVTPGGRGRPSTERDVYYHKACLEQVKAEKAARLAKERAIAASKTKKISFGWGIAGGIVALVGSLLAMLLAGKGVIPVPGAIAGSIVIGYAIFAGLYCVLSGSYVADVFTTVAGWSIRMPGVIFSLDLDGIFFLIFVKILFAFLSFFLTVAVVAFAVALSAFLGALSFPFVLAYNVKNNYPESFI